MQLHSFRVFALFNDFRVFKKKIRFGVSLLWASLLWITVELVEGGSPSLSPLSHLQKIYIKMDPSFSLGPPHSATLSLLNQPHYNSYNLCPPWQLPHLQSHTDSLSRITMGQVAPSWCLLSSAWQFWNRIPKSHISGISDTRAAAS